MSAPGGDADDELVTDRELLGYVRAGDDRSYAVLWQRHVAAVRTCAPARCRSEDVDDVVSESFARVLAAIRHGAGPTMTFRPYLLTATRHVAATLYAIIRTAPALAIDLDTRAAPGPAVDELALARLQGSALRKAYRQLPRERQQLLRLVLIEATPRPVVAARLGTRPNTLTAQLRRTQRLLLDQADAEDHR